MGGTGVPHSGSFKYGRFGLRPRLVIQRLVHRESEPATTGRTRDLFQCVVFAEFDRIVAVRATDVHGDDSLNLIPFFVTIRFNRVG